MANSLGTFRSFTIIIIAFISLSINMKIFISSNDNIVFSLASFPPRWDQT